MINPSPLPVPDPPRRRFGMPLRDLILLIVSAAAGTIAGLLLATASVPMGQAVLGGFAAFGATLYFLDRITE